MSYLDAIILGIVEGITEFLPISSTGHLMLTAKLLNLPQTEFVKTFEISIQLGAILSVVVVSRKLIVDWQVIKRVMAAFFPTAIVGLFLYKIVKHVLLNSIATVLWALLVGGIFLIIFEKYHREHPEAIDNLATLPYPKAVLIGVFQSFAMVPGVSRAAATILGGLLLGLKRKAIVEFSFLLAIPTMLASTALDLYKNIGSFSLDQLGVLLVGGFVSFVVAIFSIKFLLYFIKNHDFVWFGIYRILVAILFWVIVM